jgi:serine protease Do
MPFLTDSARRFGVDQRLPSGMAANRPSVRPRKWLLLAIALALLSREAAAEPNAPPPGTAPPEAQTVRPSGFQDMVARVKPAVFGIRARVVEKNEETNALEPLPPLDNERAKPNAPKPARLALSQGSGFFISPEGYAVTAYHVIENGASIEITTDDGATRSAKIVGVDPETDMALLKVEGKGSFPFVSFADRLPRIGEWVVTVGNPFGLGGTVTAGIVSAGAREIEGDAKNNFIQIDAPVNQGNSGGPAFDVSGRVIGVNSAIISPTGGSVGIGFAIPAEIVRPIVAELKERGVVTRGWIGVDTQAVTPELAEGFGLKQARGALIAEPEDDGPAARAGVKAGDVVVSVDGASLADDRDLAQKIGDMTPGKSVRLGIVREGRDYTLVVGLTRSPQAKAAALSDPGATSDGSADPEKLGLGLAAASETDRDIKGVVVVEVDPQGIAAERGILPGDIILAVGGTAVSVPVDVSAALAKARNHHRHNVVARIKSGESTRFVALPTG